MVLGYLVQSEAVALKYDSSAIPWQMPFDLASKYRQIVLVTPKKKISHMKMFEKFQCKILCGEKTLRSLRRSHPSATRKVSPWMQVELLTLSSVGPVDT